MYARPNSPAINSKRLSTVHRRNFLLIKEDARRLMSTNPQPRPDSWRFHHGQEFVLGSHRRTLQVSQHTDDGFAAKWCATGCFCHNIRVTDDQTLFK